MGNSKLTLEDEIYEIETRQSVSSFITTTRQDNYTHLVHFDEMIGVPSNYRGLINLLYTCSDSHEFNFFMNIGGGALSSAMAIIEAIKATDGKVRAIITGDCHSAGSIIALHCHEIMVTDSANMMCHTAAYSTGGTLSNVKSHSDFSTTYINKILDDSYIGFLTSHELSDLKKGVELWLDAEDIGKRLESRLKHLNKKSSATIDQSTKSKRQRSKTVPDTTA
jgi:ATP-dependent protease ClpP protease subunit